jgi:hypothetical protein
MRRLVVALLAVVVSAVMVGCGSSDSGSLIDRPSGTTDAPVGTETDAGLPGSDGSAVDGDELAVGIDPEVMAVAATIVDHVGPEDAFEAVVLALDAGYGVDQIAAASSTLEADGTIPGVLPENPAEGVFAASAVGSTGFGVVLAVSPGVAADPEITALEDKIDNSVSALGLLEPMSEEEEEEAEARVGLILALAGMGYSMEQIVEGLVFGEQRYGMFSALGTVEAALEVDSDEPLFKCPVLAEMDGTLVTPAMEPARIGDSYVCHTETFGRDTPLGGVKVLIDGRLVDGRTTTAPGAEGEPDEPAESDEPDEETTGARYEGTFDLSILGPMASEITVNTISVVIADGEVRGFSFHFEHNFNSVTSGPENEVLCVSEVGLRADLGPGAIDLTGDELRGTFDAVGYQTLGEGSDCREDLVSEGVERYDLEARIEGDVINGAITQSGFSLTFEARR